MKFSGTFRVIDSLIKWLSIFGLAAYLLALVLIIFRAPHQPAPEFGEVHAFVVKGFPILYVTESLYHLMAVWFGGLLVILLSFAILRSLLRSFQAEKDRRVPRLILGGESSESTDHSLR